MSMIKRVTITINENNRAIKLSSPLNFYKNDTLLIKFEIEKYNFELREYQKVNPLQAIAFIETSDGRDSVETTVIDGQTIEVKLLPKHTSEVGKCRMQFVIRDADGCQLATPPFTYEVESLINDAILSIDEDGNIIVLGQ